jgi:hypothetical protein
MWNVSCTDKVDMKRILFAISGLLIITGLFCTGSSIVKSSEPIHTPTPEWAEEIKSIENAVQESIEISRESGWAFPTYEVSVENVNISKDGTWASGLIVYRDPTTGDPIPSEPGFVLARNVDGTWQTIVPTDPEWGAALASAPHEVVPADVKEMWVGMNAPVDVRVPVAAVTGYLLPWEAGKTVSLSRSVSHDDDFPSGNAHYSFDFYISKTMYNLYAAKAGTVWSFKDSIPNNDHSDVNFLVLRDATNPDIYQLYMHLAQNSIPPSLKQFGAQVIQGQFIGVADNTGASTGHHLHFQVQTKPYWPLDNPYWGKSIDVAFNEVNIYGGHPRREYEHDSEYCGGTCEDGRRDYVSANVPKGDTTPPNGDLDGVIMGEVVESRYLPLWGWGWDSESGLYSGQLIANFSGAWHNLGEQFNHTFSYTWDLCDPNSPVPNGAVSVALRLYDNDGNWENFGGLTHFTKNYDCPSPVPECIPSNNQVALFENQDFSGGCVLYNVGNYPDGDSLGDLGNDDAESIKVGTNVIATVYSGVNYSDHSEGIMVNDSYLADNSVTANTISSMKVMNRNTKPLANLLVSPSNGDEFHQSDTVSLSWQNGGGSTQYQVRYTPQGSDPIVLNWQTVTYITLKNLQQNSYTWEVRGRNPAGQGPWSASRTFTILPPLSMPDPESIPYVDDMESSEGLWIDDGMWRLVDDPEKSRSGSYSWWYQGSDGDYENGESNSGSLTSPPVTISNSGYYLRFWYRYETETHLSYWDQRWMQISVDGGPFTNEFQLTYDPKIPEAQSWLQSPIVDLSTYAGHTIQVRFLFNTLDPSGNSYQGWGIDDFQITATPPPSCEDIRENGTPEQATAISYSVNQNTSGEICPNGDLDYYKFNGSVGDRIVVDIDAMSIGSSLDPYLILFDTDGTSILAEHDDEVYGEIRDPLLTYTLPQTGTYYIMLKAWNHPSVGGQDYNYSLRLYKDDVKPFASIIAPISRSYIPVETFDVIAQVVDVPNGVSYVEFYWHSPDWLIPNWTYLGSDYDGVDGWSYPFDPTGLREENRAAFYIHAFDKAGHMMGAGSWELGIDLTPPTTELIPLDSNQASTAILMNWTGSDTGSGIASLDLHIADDGGPWESYPGVITSSQYWIIGSSGHDYDFRSRGVDRAGNMEDFPSSEETSTSIPRASVLCSSPDSYENDNIIDRSTDIEVNGSGQVHNFCNPATPNRLNDKDWIKFNVQIGERYLIQSFPLNGNVATILQLYADNGSTLIAESIPFGFGRATILDWVSDRDGYVYLQMRHIDGRVIGNAVSYLVQVMDGYEFYMPLMERFYTFPQ